MKQLLVVFVLHIAALPSYAAQQNGRFNWDFDLSTHNPEQ